MLVRLFKSSRSSRFQKLTSKERRIEEVVAAYERRRRLIRSRLAEFRAKYTWPQEELFAELCFCLFTPQSKAESCDSAVKALEASGLLLKGSEKAVSSKMRGVRFKNQKARFLIGARYKLLSGSRKLHEIVSGSENNSDLREWLVNNVKGLGYKEASHFLRNVGLGKDLAILDRHVLKNLVSCGVIEEIPRSLTRKRYLQIEEKMLGFSQKVGIPMEELDLVFWSMQTGKVFK